MYFLEIIGANQVTQKTGFAQVLLKLFWFHSKDAVTADRVLYTATPLYEIEKQI